MGKKILFVCLGNICRSPAAEGIMEKKSDGLAIEVDSAGTAGYHIGALPDATDALPCEQARISSQQPGEEIQPCRRF